MSTLIFALPGNETLVDGLAATKDFQRGDWICCPFADGETHLRFLADVQDQVAVLACTLDRPDEKLLRLVLAADTLRELGARQVLLLAPYLPYMRQDRAFAAGEAVSARIVARLLSAHFDGVVTVDPHLHRIASLDSIYDIPTRVVAAAPAIAEWIGREIARPVLIGPDAESEQWAAAIARAAHCPYRVLEKHRSGDYDVRIEPAQLDELRDRTPVLVDDIIATGRTQIAAMAMLRQQGLPSAICVAVHAVFAVDAADVMAQVGPERVLSCNTIVHASNVIDLRPAMAESLLDLIRAIAPMH